MKKAISLFLIFCLLLSLAACKGEDEPEREATIYYNLTKEPVSLDPQIADDASSKIIIMNLYEGLVRLDKSGKATPGVAKSWSSNKDFTSFTFTLRDDAVWSNGEAVTAHDFVFAFQRALDKSTGSQTAAALYPIKNAAEIHAGEKDKSELGVKASGDTTLQIDLEYSYEDFPVVLASMVAMPCNEKFFHETGGQYGLETKAILSNGPFHITNQYAWDHGKSLSLTRSNSYRGENAPVPQGISFTIGEAPSNAANAIENGTVDASPISGAQLKKAKEQGFHLTSFDDTTWGLCFNLKSDVFQNADMRKAFLQAVDREYVLSELPENYAPAGRIVPPSTTFAGREYLSFASAGDMFPPMSDKARQTLKKGLNALELEELPSISVLCLDTPETAKIVNNLIELWNRAFGTYINMTPLSESDLRSKIAMGNYSIALSPLRAEDDGPAELLSLFSSQNESNPAQLKSKAYDNLLSTAADSPLEEAAGLYESAEKYLCDNAVFYPMYYETRYFAAASNVTGILFYPYDNGIDFSQAKKVK